ncbi:RrF2 family transcriptional regulator [Hyphomicrobium sp.]|uniref:RrF2 family transcriptional regulator n=1 Tax=Hyphomicrobium sp. TaxID=82 RepID=UPI002FDF1142
MTYLGTSHEYGLHCLLWLVEPCAQPLSSRDLAALQGVPFAYLAKIFAKLEKAGIVSANDGIRGGYRLARDPDEISVLDVVEAIDGKQPLFECQGIRSRCAVFGDSAPAWSTDGVCAVHAVMLRAEARMREELASASIGELARILDRKVPLTFPGEVGDWIAKRHRERTAHYGRRSRASERPADALGHPNSWPAHSIEAPPGDVMTDDNRGELK